MKQIEFERIKIRNFLSYGKEPVELTFQNGITFVTGYNHDKKSHNGVGKTALIIESLSYVLFGETYRKIVNARISNWKTKDTCSVELWLKINGVPYYICRSMKPDNLIFMEDGKEIQKTKPQTNKDIIEKLEIGKEIFTNTLVMTNDTSVAFLRQTITANKTKFVEGLLNLEVFSKMNVKAGDRFKAKDKENDVKDAKIEEAKRTLKTDEQCLINETSKKEKEISTYEDQIRVLKNTEQIDNSEKIEEINRKIGHISDQKSKHDVAATAIISQKAEIEAEIKIQKRDLDKQNSIKTECPTCKRPYSEHNKDDIECEKKQITEKLEKYRENLIKVNEAQDLLYKKYQELDAKTASLKKELDKAKIEQEKWRINQEKISNVQTLLEKTRQRENPFDEKVRQSKLILEQYQNESFFIKKQLNILEITKSSINQIKATVIKKIIRLLNSRINYYLGRLDSPVSLVFDEFFEEKIIFEGLDISYGNLSGGESKRVDIALLFAFRDIRRLQSGVSINISVFDELFDSAVDAKAMQDILALLKEMSDKEGFYIITHRQENVEVETCNVIRLEKKNGITKIL